MGDRKAFTKIAVDWIKKIIPGSDYPRILEGQLNGLSDDQFEVYVRHLEETGDSIPIVVPVMSSTKIDVMRNIAIAKELGYEFFQHLLLTDPVTGATYKTPIKYLVLQLPFRRQQQMLEEKASIPETNRHVNDLTGQPTGPSKGASLTYPEIQVMRSQEWDNTLTELLKYRGGDTRGFQAMNRSISDQGGVSLQTLSSAPTMVKSTETLYVYLLSAHLDNNI